MGYKPTYYLTSCYSNWGDFTSISRSVMVDPLLSYCVLIHDLILKRKQPVRLGAAHRSSRLQRVYQPQLLEFPPRDYSTCPIPTDFGDCHSCDMVYRSFLGPWTHIALHTLCELQHGKWKRICMKLDNLPCDTGELPAGQQDCQFISWCSLSVSWCFEWIM